MAGTAAVNHFELTVFGPFYRAASTTQDAATIRAVLASGELWGRTPQYGVAPTVQAYAGELPDGEEGFEFFAVTPPDRPHGPQVYWRAHRDSSVEGDQEWAKLKVLVSRVAQEL